MYSFPVIPAQARSTGRGHRSRRFRRAALAVLAALYQSRERAAQRIVCEQRSLLDKDRRNDADRSEPT